MSCVCQDVNLARNCECWRCATKWSRPLDHFERMAGCPEHHLGVAICSPGTRDFLCQACEDQGYYIEQNGVGFTADFAVKHRNEDPQQN